MSDLARTFLEKYSQFTQRDNIDNFLNFSKVIVADMTKMYPADEWNEELGEVLWYRLPIVEPPYVGSPLNTNWHDEDPFPFHPMTSRADYYTHFQLIHIGENT